jgi:hypothetical protein
LRTTPFSANVHPNDFIYEMRDSRSREYAAECRKHAGAVGISSTEMKGGFDDLEMAMAKAMPTAARQSPFSTGRSGF